MKRSHFIKMLGVGAAMPLLLKAGVSLEKKYVPLGFISAEIKELGVEASAPEGTRHYEWQAYDGDTGETFHDLRYVITANDRSGIYTYFSYTNRYNTSVKRSPVTGIRIPFGARHKNLRFYYNPWGYADPRYTDYLKPDWQKPGHRTIEGLVKRIRDNNIGTRTLSSHWEFNKTC